MTATDGLAIEQCLQTTRNHIDLLSVTKTTSTCQGEQDGIGMAPRESGCKAQAEAG